MALLDWLCSPQALGWLSEGSDTLVDATIQQALDYGATINEET